MKLTLNQILKELEEALKALWPAIQSYVQRQNKKPMLPEKPIIAPIEHPELVTPHVPSVDVLEPWGDPISNRHNVRVICDQENLTVPQKNLVSQVIHCESGYHTLAVHPNIYDGRVVSTDRGICQWNDHYHGAEISADEAFNDPEKCVRLMCKYVKAGRINQWVCYSSGLYRQYSA